MKLSILFIAVISIILSSCTNINQSIQESNTILELKKEDFELSEQVVGKAVRTQIFGIDFKRLFTKTSGTTQRNSITSESPVYHVDISTIYNLPIIGNRIQNKTVGYALYALLTENPGYDVILYPQYKINVRRPIGLGFIWRRTEVDVTARLGKLK